ncbi:MAG TPA: hypothetical protein VGD98_11870 [Ktedonobacteraceae bacterium]
MSHGALCPVPVHTACLLISVIKENQVSPTGGLEAHFATASIPLANSFVSRVVAPGLVCGLAAHQATCQARGEAPQALRSLAEEFANDISIHMLKRSNAIRLE